MRIETKLNAPAGANTEARALTAEVLAAFEALKSANDARIEEIEERGALDPLVEGKLKKIEQSLDRQRTALERLALEQSRPPIGDDPCRTYPEHTAAWSAFRANARFVMNRRTVSRAPKLTDTDGNYLWRPGGAGEVPSLLGYPVTEMEDMPDIAANAFAIAFGDFRRGYLIVDSQGTRVVRDPYSAKPYVLFCTIRRVGGGAQNVDAIKVMKFAAS